jgi:hypothetical protein
MIKRVVNILVLIPIAIVLIVLSVANRQAVTLALNPFRPEDSVLSVTAPFFVYLFLAVIFGPFSARSSPGSRKANTASVPASRRMRP